MKKLVSMQLLAVASLAIACPLVASASSVSEMKAYESLHQPLNTQPSETAQRAETNEFVFKTGVHVGESHAMNEVRQRIHEETTRNTYQENERAASFQEKSDNSAFPHGRDW